MKRLIVTKFSSQYFNLERHSIDWDEKSPDKIKIEIANRLIQIFEWIDFENNWLMVVSSGAVALGRFLNGNLKENSIIRNAIYASLWQPVLMEIWKVVFNRFGLNVWQILIDYTHENDKSQIDHLEKLLFSLINNKIVPIINFNDSMSGIELRNLSRFVDNDKTFEFIVNLLKDIFKNLEIIGIIYSDRPLQTLDKNGNLNWVIHKIVVEDEEYKNYILSICNWKSWCWTGWMKSKVETAWRLVEDGKASKIVITWPQNINEILNWENDNITLFSK